MFNVGEEIFYPSIVYLQLNLWLYGVSRGAGFRGREDWASKLLMTGATDRDLGKQVEGDILFSW